MSEIREDLVLYDRFTEAFTRYIREIENASESTRRMRQIIDDLEGSQRRTAAASSDLASTIRNLAGTYLGFQGARSMLDLSDMIASNTARLDMMNDGLQTTEELNQMIFDSAQRSRGAYADTAAFVAQLGNLAGDAFSSSAEVVAFAEQINKQMAISGTAGQQAEAAMLQLTQGLASGALRGEELNSVMENSSMIAQTIADYMGVTTGELRELASEGQVTATIVKNAMFAAAEETNAKFAEMPMTWAQQWNQMKNLAIQAVMPLLESVNQLANSQSLQTAINMAVEGIRALATAAEFLIDNLDIILPLLLGIGGAFVIFQVAANWTRIAEVAMTAYQFAVNLLSIGFGVLRGSTAASSAAMFQFNSVLLASPITWIVMIIMLLVGVIYAAVAAFNHFTGAGVSATGVIAGAFLTLLAFLANTIVIPIQRTFAALGNFIGNVFNDPVTAVKVLFYDMALRSIGWVSSIASALEKLLNSIPGFEVNFTSGLDNLYSKMEQERAKAIESGSYKEFFKAWDYIDLSDAWDTGYNWGANLFKGGDPMKDFMSEYEPTAVPGSETNKLLEDIANSTKGIEKSVDMSNEDIQSLVDVVERRYVANVNLTSQAPVINVAGQNTGNTAADRQALADAIQTVLLEQIPSTSVRATAMPT